MASLKRWWIGDIAQNNLVNEFSGFGFVSGTVKPGQPSRGKAEIDTHTLVRILMMVDDDAKPSSMNGGDAHFGYASLPRHHGGTDLYKYHRHRLWHCQGTWRKELKGTSSSSSKSSSSRLCGNDRSSQWCKTFSPKEFYFSLPANPHVVLNSVEVIGWSPIGAPWGAFHLQLNNDGICVDGN